VLAAFAGDDGVEVTKGRHGFLLFDRRYFTARASAKWWIARARAPAGCQGAAHDAASRRGVCGQPRARASGNATTTRVPGV
jgi:hypothetical protein